jgi:APA family basic amino acid/polyamine antiporter
MVALVLNCIIGAGIFGLPGTAFRLSGTYSLAAFTVCAVLVICFALSFSEVGSRFSGTGGPYLYARDAFGPFIGFQIGWLLWVARVTAYASLANLFASYLGIFWPAAAAGAPRAIVLTLLVAVITVVNFVGVKPSTTFTNIFTAGKLSALLFFIVAGMFFIEPANYLTGRVPTYAEFSQTVLILVFAFTGFEMAVIPAGETINPGKNAPFGLLVGIPIVVALYVLIQVVAIGTLPGLAASARPLADASQRVLGGWAAAIVSLGALVSITGTLNSVLLVSGRLIFAMAEDRRLPASVGAVHARFRTPHRAILLSSAAILALTLSGSFVAMAAISTVTRLLVYAATCAALFAFRRRERAPFVAPLGAAAATVALALTAWVLSNSPFREIWMTGAAAAAGTVLYFGFTPHWNYKLLCNVKSLW